MNIRLLSGFTILLLVGQFLVSCSTTYSTLNPNTPHTYLNSYPEVLDATQKALQRSGMKVLKAKKVDEGKYYFHYFKSRYDLAGNNNAEGGLGADLTITKLSKHKTKVVIQEEEQPDLLPGQHKETLGKDVLRELNKLLEHESPEQSAS